MSIQVTTSQNYVCYLHLDDVYFPPSEHSFPESNGKEFFIYLDPILQPICEELQKEIYKKEKGKPGKYPIEVLPMIKAHLYAKLNNDMAYRALQREMLRRPELVKALGFQKVPSHQAMHDFRARFGSDRLNKIVNGIINSAIGMGLTNTKEVIIDSAPIKTFVNFGKANKTPSFDINEVTNLFKNLNLKELMPKFNIKINTRISLDSIIAFKIFGELGGFLSFNSSYNFVKKSKEIREILGFSGRFPAYVTLKTKIHDIEKLPENKDLMNTIIENIAKFFYKGNELSQKELSEIKYFFGVLRKGERLVDPEARIGYCSSKDEFYLGYKVHLIISKKIT